MAAGVKRRAARGEAGLRLVHDTLTLSLVTAGRGGEAAPRDGEARLAEDGYCWVKRRSEKREGADLDGRRIDSHLTIVPA
jgi:hypothetical protein